ncbi:MAG: hypothetical protein ACP5JG_12925 [Anaerolineae bacterium]
MNDPRTPTTKITPGRRPTMGEVLDYYTQENFLRFLLATTRHRRVVLVISSKKHWEPRWSRDEVQAGTVDELRDWILSKIESALPGVATDARPDYYPAFHQSVWKGDAADTQSGTPRDIYMDCVFEADLPTWRDAFHDVNAVIELFERYDVHYQHKFSGHRSLHFVIPGDILPRGFRGQASGKLAGMLLRWSGSHAHHLPKITRMPYSLNEDTGLVCLPIDRGGLPAFRPWQANLHLVDVPAASWDIWGTGTGRRNLAALVTALESQGEQDPFAEIESPERTPAVAQSNTILATYHDRIARIAAAGVDGPLGTALRLLHSDEPMPESTLLESLTSEDPDARWLAAEAYLLHGRSISK